MTGRGQNGSWRARGIALATALLCLLPSFAHAQRPGERIAPYGERPGRIYPAPHPGGTGSHLQEWMDRHRNLTAEQREQALRHEPGFERLAPEQQQRLLERLHRFNMQTPAERDRLNAWNERFLAMPPERQQRIRAASQTLGQMPPDRRRALSNAFHDLRSLPPEQRQSVLDSARFRAEYSPQERSILGDLLSIEPYRAVPPR